MNKKTVISVCSLHLLFIAVFFIPFKKKDVIKRPEAIKIRLVSLTKKKSVPKKRAQPAKKSVPKKKKKPPVKSVKKSYKKKAVPKPVKKVSKVSSRPSPKKDLKRQEQLRLLEQLENEVDDLDVDDLDLEDSSDKSEIDDYHAKLNRLIRQHWKQPSQSELNGNEKVRIQLTFAGSGKILSSTIIQTCNNSRMNLSVSNLLKTIKRGPALPNGLKAPYKINITLDVKDN